MASLVFNSAKKKIMDGTIDLVNDTLKLMLVTSTYSPNQDTHDFKDDVTNEVSGTGYTAGGKTLTGKVANQDNTNNRSELDADDVTWSGATLTARGAVLYKDTGVAATSPIICYFDFGSDESANAEDFTVAWNAEGILQI